MPIFYPFADLGGSDLQLDYSEYHRLAHGCKYMLPTEAASKLKLHNNFASIHINARSIKCNFNSILTLLDQLNYNLSALMISESWLESSSCDYYNIDGYYQFATCRKHSLGGGALLYISNKFNCHRRPDLEIATEEIQSVFVEISNDSGANIICGTFYKAPHAIYNELTEYLENVLHKVSNEKKYFTCGHDSNVCLFRKPEFFDCLASYGVFPSISRPTRITNTSQSLIDNILCNQIESCLFSCVCLENLSDHNPVITIQNFNLKPHNVSYHNKIFNFKRIHLFRDYIKTEIDDMKDSEDPNVIASNMTSILNKGVNRFSTDRKGSRRKCPHKPYITNIILDQINTKNKLYKKFLSNPSPENETIYKDFKNNLTYIIRKAHKDYVQKQLDNHKEEPKKMWDFLLNTINKKRKSSGELPTQFQRSDNALTDPYLIANSFNEFFINIAHELDSKLPSATTNPLDYLRSINIGNSLFLHPTSPFEIEKIISELKVTGPGIDLISTKIFISVLDILLPLLTYLMNLCLSKGTFPDPFKRALIKPIFKSGDQQLFNNYRPISILPFLSKILEKLIYIRLSTFIHDNKILSEDQFGFRKKRSTFMPIIEFYDRVTKSLEKGYCTAGIYLDLSKAFDTVNIEILLSKLHIYGIRGLALDMIRSYLSNRTQSLKYHNTISSPLTVNCGVPQGSILGPLLFILYINDLPTVISGPKFSIFADDTVFYIEASTINDLQTKINTYLPSITEWFLANRLTINSKKTFYQVYSNFLFNPEQFDIEINNQRIQHSYTVKYLGVLIDQNLKWQSHINHLSAIINRNIGIISRARHLLSSYHLLLLYNSLILPYLSYCTAIWGSNYISSIQKIIIAQKRAVRIIDNSPFNAHTNAIFIKHKLLKFQDIVSLQQLIILFRFLRGDLPAFFSQLLSLHTNVRLTRSHYHFNIPFTNRNYRTFSISIAGPKIWNSIVPALGSIEEIPARLQVFKRIIKDHFLHSYALLD